MSAARDNINLGFTNESYPAGTHMCLIYSGEEERVRTIAQYIQSGLAAGERVAYFSDANPADESDEQFVRQELQLPTPEAGGQFSVSKATDTYCPSGKFVPEEMFETLRQFHDQAHADGYSACRVSGEMSWALRGMPGCERLMEYESKLNDVFVNHPVTAICQYDATHFDAGTLMECLKVHPFVIVNGQILRNRYYLNPAEYLRTVRKNG